MPSQMFKSVPFRSLSVYLSQLIITLLVVTFIIFALIDVAGPDQAFERLGRHGNQQQLEALRSMSGDATSTVQRYFDYIVSISRQGLGQSEMTGESVSRLLINSVWTTLLLTTPGVVIGMVLAVFFAMISIRYRRRWPAKLISILCLSVMSLSFVIVVVIFQSLFASSSELDWFPVSGWDVTGLGNYLKYVSLPTLIIVTMNLGYNLLFIRTLLSQEFRQPYVAYARVHACPESMILLKRVLPNCLPSILARFFYSLPGMIIATSLILETHFSIPGLGKVVFDAMLFRDTPVLIPVIAATTLLFILARQILDKRLQKLDPENRMSQLRTGAF